MVLTTVQGKVNLKYIMLILYHIFFSQLDLYSMLYYAEYMYTYYNIRLCTNYAQIS